MDDRARFGAVVAKEMSSQGRSVSMAEANAIVDALLAEQERTRPVLLVESQQPEDLLVGWLVEAPISLTHPGAT